MARHLVDPADRLAVDVGCGAGGMTQALAAAMTGGRVVGVDGEEQVLARAREHVDGTAAAAGIEFVALDFGTGVPALAATLGAPADLVWASASVHHVGDQQAAVDALAGLLAPGGRIALAEGGLPLRHLPWDVGVGEPGLEIRLEAAQDRWFARMRAALPGAVAMPYGWTEALRRAGLTEVTTRSWLLETPPPLDAEDRRAVAGTLAHRVDRLRSTGLLDPADLAAWDRLVDPDDPAWLGRREDLSRLTARSVHLGRRP